MQLEDVPAGAVSTEDPSALTFEVIHELTQAEGCTPTSVAPRQLSPRFLFELDPEILRMCFMSPCRNVDGWGLSLVFFRLKCEVLHKAASESAEGVLAMGLAGVYFLKSRRPYPRCS